MDAGGSQKDPVPLLSLLPALTQQYRNDVLQLCQESNTCESWFTTQYLLDKCWVDAPNLPNNDCESIVHLCPQCGAWLHPGWQGSSLRVARFCTQRAAHRTRRRRVQRKKRRSLLLQSKKAKEFNTNKQTSPVSKSLAPPVEQVLLRNDSDLFLDRHHLVIRCGRCDAKIRIKGLKRELPPTKQMLQQSQADRVGASAMRHTRQMSSAPSTSSNEVLGDGESDFLQLPPGPFKAKTTTKTNPTLSKHTPLHLRNPKKDKNKSKGSGGKDSKLLNFLSSLND